MHRIGILGCARIVRRGVAAGIAGSAAAALHGIASRNKEQAEQWAAELGATRAHSSYEQLIADPEIDAVYIPLPNELHREWTLRAADAGKHVLCEKPLALNAAEAEEMVEHCRRRGVMLMEAFMWRHHPRVVQAKRLVDGGAIGELRLVKMDFSFQIDAGDWRLHPNRGGGALFDIGCYGINATRLFAGSEPEYVHALARFAEEQGSTARYAQDRANSATPAGSEHAHASVSMAPTHRVGLAPEDQNGEGGVDMTVGVSLQFPGGMIGLCDASFESPYRNRIEIVGSRGAMELPGGVLPPPESQLILHTDAGEQTLTFSGDQYAEEVKVFAASIAAGRLLPPAEDGLANMRVLEEALRVARKGC